MAKVAPSEVNKPLDPELGGPKIKKEPKARRPEYPILNSPKKADGKPNVVDDKLVTVPTDYDPKSYRPLKKNNFSDDAGFLEYKSMLLSVKASQFTEKANDALKQAAELRKYGDPQLRKQVAKRDRIQKQLEALNVELQAADKTARV